MLLLILLLILFLYKLYKINLIEKFVNYKKNNNNYKVYENYENFVDAGELLHKLNGDIINLKIHLKKKYVINNNPVSNINLKRIKNFIKKYKNNVLNENYPRSISAQSSFTKGKKSIHMCLRSYENDKFHSYNELLFVLLHECAHMACYDLKDHPDEFWCFFELLLKEATELKLYTPIDYSKETQKYCNTVIDYSPLYETEKKCK